MDIFTTQLTRVVPVPIKPANLKVKALLKESGTGKLKEDLDHLENHDYYFQDDLKKQQKKQQDNAQGNSQDNSQSAHQANQPTDNNAAKQAESTQLDTSTTANQAADKTNSTQSKSKDGSKHLDLYV